VRRIAIPGAVVQIVVAVAMGMGLAHAWGWGIGPALVFGLCLSVASTVVLLKALEARGLIETVNGRIAIGWLVVEDLVMVLVLVLMPAVAGMLSDKPAAATSAGQPLWLSLTLTLAKVMAFIATMLLIGRRVLPRMLWWVARTGSRELFTLSVVAAAVGVAFGAAKLFDVSFALGAFFAGMMMQESEFSHRAADESLPLRDAFAVLFFVSVGMLFDPTVLWHSPGKLAATVAVILLGKTLAAVALVLLFRYPLNTALTVGASLAQIGEFSFILAGLGVSLGMLPQEGQSLILAAAIVSIAVNAGLFGLLAPLLNWARAHSALARRLEARDDPLAQLPSTVDQARLHGQVVLVGYGQVGQHLAALLHEQKINFVVADEGRDVVESLRQAHVPAVTGDLSDPATLIQAHIARAGALVITLPDSLLIHQLVDIARQLNAGIRVLVYCASADEAALLRKDLEVEVFVLEQELAKGMARQVAAWIEPGTHVVGGADVPHGH
ncbi:MAG TPA: cation:proton antiporter, partial [Aquabacterium sp.]|uniref:cation:proton antiporter domain-containing protein n=1 Tax=Aquabacterium sp. TaxID=1872578 RepID=UPI002E37740D